MKIQSYLSFILLVLIHPYIFGQQPRIESCDCSFDTSQFKDSEVHCGKLLVPENRETPDNKIIQIAFAVITPENATSDPVVVLPGGPGGSPLGSPVVSMIKSWIPENRALVIFDPRGTGESGPIMCSDLNDTSGTIAAMDLTIEEERKVRLGLDLACRDKLLREQIDLNAYNSITVAQDVNDLMTALGYEHYNLLGGSYGVPMSAMIMRLFPDKIRSATLLSGPYLDLTAIIQYDVPNFARNLEIIFEKCANDEQCGKLYPNLKEDFYTVYEELKTKPMGLQVDPTKFRSPQFILNSQDYITIMYWLQTRETRIRYFPRLIQAFKNREMDVITRLVEREFGGLGSESSRMGILVHCYDSYTEHSLSDWKREAAPYHPALAEITYFLNPCEYWTNEAAPDSLRRPFKSDIPTFLITGELDAMNPPSAGDSFLPWFGKAQHVTIPGMGHMFPSNRESACWSEMIYHFITNPQAKIKADCIEEIPEIEFKFELPSWAKGS